MRLAEARDIVIQLHIYHESFIYLRSVVLISRNTGHHEVSGFHLCALSFPPREDVVMRTRTAHNLPQTPLTITVHNQDKNKTPIVLGVVGCGQKSFKLVWWCHRLLSGFLAKGRVSRVLRQSRRLLMIRNQYF